MGLYVDTECRGENPAGQGAFVDDHWGSLDKIILSFADDDSLFHCRADQGSQGAYSRFGLSFGRSTLISCERVAGTSQKSQIGLTIQRGPCLRLCAIGRSLLQVIQEAADLLHQLVQK